MKGPFEVWRRSLWIWVLPVAFCLLNLGGFAVYHSVYAGQVERLEARYQGAEDELAALRAEVEQIDGFLARIAGEEAAVHRLYSEHFLTEAERFTRSIREVKELARKAGLDPTSFSYPQEQLGGGELIRRGIVFSVEGTYRQLRTFINFLELDQQFLALEGISLSEASYDPNNPTLAIRLQMWTIFARPGAADELAEELGEVLEEPVT
jgi:hypothetical protein